MPAEACPDNLETELRAKVKLLGLTIVPPKIITKISIENK